MYVNAKVRAVVTVPGMGLGKGEWGGGEVKCHIFDTL
jgi:hypothetical protein